MGIAVITSLSGNVPACSGTARELHNRCGNGYGALCCCRRSTSPHHWWRIFNDAVGACLYRRCDDRSPARLHVAAAPSGGAWQVTVSACHCYPAASGDSYEDTEVSVILSGCSRVGSRLKRSAMKLMKALSFGVRYRVGG